MTFCVSQVTSHKSPHYQISFFDGRNAEKVCSGGIHSMALCDGKVFTWGCGSDGRLGHPECEGHRYLYKESTPLVIASKHVASDISCSYYHSACVARPNTN